METERIPISVIASSKSTLYYLLALALSLAPLAYLILEQRYSFGGVYLAVLFGLSAPLGRLLVRSERIFSRPSEVRVDEKGLHLGNDLVPWTSITYAREYTTGPRGRFVLVLDIDHRGRSRIHVERTRAGPQIVGSAGEQQYWMIRDHVPVEVTLAEGPYRGGPLWLFHMTKNAGRNRRMSHR